MNTYLEKAKQILLECDYTCVLYNGNDIRYSQKRGVKPLIEFLKSKDNFSNYCAADKVVGAGAAHLYVLLSVKSVWAKVISHAAKEILNRNNISVFYEKEVPHIINRTCDGVCPIEAAVNGITDSNTALAAIEKRLQELA